jgi:hypothetical protein
MAELAVPALRGLSRAQYDAFRQNVARLAAADEKLDLFEFALQKLLLRRLAPSFGKVDRQIVHYRAVTPLLPDCRIVLSTLARLGNRGAEAAARAYGSAFIRLAKTGEGALPSTAAGPARTGPTGEAGKTGLLPIEACGLKVLDQSLNRLAAASPVVKERIVDACARCVTADGSVTVKEAELLRAVVDALDCPLPPFLPTAPSL